MTQQIKRSALPAVESGAATRLALYVQIPVYRAALLDRLKDREDVNLTVANSIEELPSALDGAEALIFNGSAYTDEVHAIVRAYGTNLRWFHSTSAGNERLIENGVPEHVTVTRSGGHSAPVVAEHAIALLLALARGLPLAWENQRNRKWLRDRTGRRIGTTRSLIGRTAVVLGFGPIGQAIAARLKTLEMSVLAVTRTGRPCEGADRTFAVEDLKVALSTASVLVVAAPGGSDTIKLVGAEELAAMQADSFVVNVGRGTVIDTAAIEAALRDGTILGAGLDVVDPEPLPEDHSLWGAPNLIITPHRAGGGDPFSAFRQANAVLENLDRFQRGQPLKHVLQTRIRP